MLHASPTSISAKIRPVEASAFYPWLRRSGLPHIHHGGRVAAVCHSEIVTIVSVAALPLELLLYERFLSMRCLSEFKCIKHCQTVMDLKLRDERSRSISLCCFYREMNE